MSYVLHLWEAPAVATFQEAEALVWQPKAGPPSPRFPAFAAALHAVLPEEWLEPGLDGKTDEPIYAFGVSSAGVAAGAVEQIAHIAAEQRMHLYDMQGGYLVTPDGTMVLNDGTLLEMGDRPEPDLPPPADAIDGDAANVRILQRLGQALARHGWTLYPEEGHRGLLARQRGPVVQKISFGVYEGGDEFQINVYLGFSSPAVRDALRKLLPESAALLDGRLEVKGRFADDFSPMLNVLGDASNLSGEWLVPSAAQVDAWTDRFIAWYEAGAGARLDACNSLPELNRLTHTAAELARVPSGDLDQMLATLLLVHLCNDPVVPVDAWIGCVRKMQDGQYGWACRNYAEDPSAHAEMPQPVKESAIVDRLVQRLQRRHAG
jgi:hypothetical protein